MSLKVGIQMFSVRNAMAKNPVETIRKVAEQGYKYIELANLTADKDFGCGFGASAKALNEAIAPFGAQVVSAHIDPLDESNVDRVLEYHAILGTQYIMSKSLTTQYDEIVKQCETLNKIGEKCKQYGIAHCLHTGFNNIVIQDKDVLTVYTENTDDGNLYFEFDTYWALRSGSNPIEAIKKHAPYIELLHQKDIPATMKNPVNLIEAWGGFDMEMYGKHIGADDFAEVGTGVMDIQGIIDTAVAHTNCKYIILEQDFTKLDEFDSIALSMKGFRKYTNIDWK